MPSISQAQHDFMVKVYEDPKFAKRVNVPKKVAKEFLDKDKEGNLWQTSAEDATSESLRDQRFEEQEQIALYHLGKKA